MALRIHRDSIVWLVAAAAAFTLAVMLFTPMRMSLGWDETVYASQISQHVPIMRWSSERARGMPLLVAPVTLFPDYWIGIGALASAGLFLRGLVTGRATTGILAALAAAVAFAALMRLADAVFL